MKHPYKVVVVIHPLMDLLVEALLLEIGVQNQPDSLEIRAILRQVPIANHREQMGQLFGLPDDPLWYLVSEIILERSIGKL